MRYLLLCLLVPLWAIQYGVAVPSVWAIHLLGGLLRFGLLTFMLIFIPIVGWAVLAFKVWGNPRPNRHRTNYTPWLRRWVTQ